MRRLDPKCLPVILKFVMDKQLETGAVDCQEAEKIRDQIVRLLEDEANKEYRDRTFIIYYEVKFKIRGKDYSLMADPGNFIEVDQTGEKQS